jgi:tetratricopeptide (TPR) repeat protein
MAGACVRDALGNHAEALQDCDTALSLAQSRGIVDADIYYNKGVVLDSLKRFQEAIDQYNMALNIEPKVAKHFNNRGYAKQQLEMYQDAVNDYTKCLELSEQFIATPYVNRTRCYEVRKRSTPLLPRYLYSTTLLAF